MNEWMNDWMNEWMNERTNERTNEQTNEQLKKLRNEGWMTLWKRWTFQGVGVCLFQKRSWLRTISSRQCVILYEQSNCVEYVESSCSQNKSNLETKITSIKTRL